MKSIVLFSLLATCLTSCYSYKIFPSEYRQFSYQGEKKKAFITNPELTKETRILKRSGVFQLTEDSLDQSAVKIKLYPFKRRLACGQPIVASVITLGQVPVLFTDRYDYKFDEVQKDSVAQRQFEFDIATRVWFWDMFKFHKRFNEKAAQVLLASYYSHTD